MKKLGFCRIQRGPVPWVFRWFQVQYLFLLYALLCSGCDESETDSGLQEQEVMESEDKGREGSKEGEWTFDEHFISDTNRRHPTMFGGWGPHLRAPFVDEQGTRWFTADQGPDVSNNTTLQVFKQEEETWKLAGTVSHTAGVQQNSAVLWFKGKLYAYSINVTQNFLEECIFDPRQPEESTCDQVVIGAPYRTPDLSNYVGAAVSESGTRVVWFTEVGLNGGSGALLYAYNSGEGWNGPVRTALAGHNDLAYVRAVFTAPNAITFVGDAYFGSYPSGYSQVLLGHFSLGQPVELQILPTPPGKEIVRADDIWWDGDRRSLHILAEGPNVLAYYHVGDDASGSQDIELVRTFPHSTQARFIAEGSDTLWLIRRASGGGIETFRAAVSEHAVDWDKALRLSYKPRESGFLEPYAIYPSRSSYQGSSPAGLDIALCGGAGADNKLLHLRLIWE